MAWKNGFIIEYVQPEYIQQHNCKNRVRKKIDCRNCKHCNLEERTCKSRKNILFYEGPGCGSYWGYYKNCKYFSPQKYLSEEQQESARQIVNKYKKQKGVGKNKSAEKEKSATNKALMEKPAFVDRLNGNRRIIYKACEEHFFDDDNRLLSDIVANNYVELWNVKGEKKVCDCGSKIKFLTGIEVDLHAGEALISVLIPGKKCLECNKIFLVKGIVIDFINEIKEEVKHQEDIDSKCSLKGYQMKLSDLQIDTKKNCTSKCDSVESQKDISESDALQEAVKLNNVTGYQMKLSDLKPAQKRIPTQKIDVTMRRKDKNI